MRVAAERHADREQPVAAAGAARETDALRDPGGAEQERADHGELLEVEGEGAQAQFRTNVPYSALEAFEADNRSRMIYRISNTNGVLIDGFQDLPAWRGQLPQLGPYAALVDFYDDTYRGDAVRVAVLLQPFRYPST